MAPNKRKTNVVFSEVQLYQKDHIYFGSDIRIFFRKSFFFSCKIVCLCVRMNIFMYIIWIFIFSQREYTFTISSCSLVPESTRWLTCNQKFAKAESSIKEMISCNTRAVPDVLELCDDTRLYVMSTSHPRRHTYLDLFHTSTVGRWTVAVLYTWYIYSIFFTITPSNSLSIYINIYI